MEPDESQLRAVPEAGVLSILPNGIAIVRRRKHEPISLEGLSRDEIVRRTNKQSGSKFLPGTSLARIVEITREILEESNVQPGDQDGGHYAKIYDEPIGISNGRQVRAARVRTRDGCRRAHAYPEDERRV
jgi:hypothetical protein